MEPQQPHRPAMDDAPPIILPAEVEALIKKLDHSKAPGEDHITGGVLQDGGEAVVNLLTRIFKKCLQLCQVPKAWQNAVMILLHKKANTWDIKNYRPISLLPIIYKVFSHILLQWILQTLDFHQPSEQAGFRAGFSTIDHLPVVTTNSKKKHTSTTSHSTLHLWTMRKLLIASSLSQSSMLSRTKAYLNIIKHLYHDTSVICLHTDSKKFRLQRGVRQGDNISPRLFTSYLQDAFIGKINWKDRGITIDGEYLSQLIFADDIVLISKSTSELQKMIQDIFEQANQ